MAVDVTGLDVELLKSEIKKTYARVSHEPEEDFIFPTGRAWAAELGYSPELANVAERAPESFAGLSNPGSSVGSRRGQRVLDVSKFEDTRRKAEKFGARGTTVKANKPRR